MVERVVVNAVVDIRSKVVDEEASTTSHEAPAIQISSAQSLSMVYQRFTREAAVALWERRSVLRELLGAYPSTVFVAGDVIWRML